MKRPLLTTEQATRRASRNSCWRACRAQTSDHGACYHGTSCHGTSAGRSGATLSEALIALLVMAIGVVSLAALFPIAVLKTARASQLTSATDIRYNAEAMMKVYPWIFSDPNPVDDGPNGVPDGNRFNDYDFAMGRAFVFDPQGLVTRPVALAGALGVLPRYSGGFNSSQAAADVLCAGPDTWTILHEGAVTTANPTTQTTVDGLASVAMQYPGANQMRVQLIYNGGKNSLTRMITGIGAGNTLIWTEDVNGNSMLDTGEDHNGNFVLDAHTVPAGITYETARVEARERRYTWMLTVRPQDTGSSFGGASGARPSFDVTVVVFYGRAFDPRDEQVYGTLPAGVPAVANLVATSTCLMPAGQRLFNVTWPAGEEPNLKRGGYILDAQNGYWYQIENYTDPGLTNSTTITLASNILETSTLGIFYKSVVDVFPIAPQSP